MNFDLNISKISTIIDDFNPNRFGLFFSLFLHLLILLFAIGLPDFFKPKQIMLPNIIPIEIINVSDNTSINIKEKEVNQKSSESKVVKNKKFNSSENLEIKRIELQKKPEINKKKIPDTVLKKEVIVKEKIVTKKVETEKVKQIDNIEKFESLDTLKIKPKLKPKPKIKIEINKSTDVRNDQKPQEKPKPDFSIASMLKDLRNEKSNNVIKEKIEEKIEENNEKINNSDNINKDEGMILSISEIDLLRQQLSSCWNAPAGAVIEKGMSVTVSAKIRKNRRVIENSIRIVDTNIPKSNTFYGPITESAMRTLLNPECTPLKLPSDKYNLWKNLTITFDYSIMKGYSG